MRAADLVRTQIMRFARDHAGTLPLFLEVTPEVFEDLRKWLVSRGLARDVYEAYCMFEDVEIFPVGRGNKMVVPKP